MTQINFTLDTNQIQELIENSGANDLAKQMLTVLFNQLMEKQRDEYIQVDPYSRDDNRKSSRNGYYEREFTTRIGTLNLVTVNSLLRFLIDIKETKRPFSLQFWKCMYKVYRLAKYPRLSRNCAG